MADESNFIAKEVPVETPDSSNTTFTLAHEIEQIDDVWVDGCIFLGTISYTSGGTTFTLDDAPTSDIEVDYYYL